MITNDAKKIEILITGGKILARVLNMVSQKAIPGVSAWDLNLIAEKEIKRLSAKPSFKNYQAFANGPKFPGALCVSVNEEVVHGIPARHKILKDGDIVGLDLGVEYHGLYTDSAVTVGVGRITQKAQELINTAKLCLTNALAQAKAGQHIGDIGFAIESTAKNAGFEVVRDLVGHGVGLSVHEDPDIPGFGEKGKGLKLELGMVLAIEPMVNEGSFRVTFEPDGWTVKTHDRKLSAHFEHTIIVTKSEPIILTQE